MFDHHATVPGTNDVAVAEWHFSSPGNVNGRGRVVVQQQRLLEAFPGANVQWLVTRRLAPPVIWEALPGL
ncbi:MAG TPA: hypothetical protein PKN95_02970 [Verrucomicrobiota bacterium]|nr:hypothetical protein [Verrucomicrobiota bacterium]HNT13274.1 hypothetical protein [Verrucomicrobiota bacterium]